MDSFFEDLSALHINVTAPAPTVSDILTKVPVSKPNMQTYFRINPDAAFRLNTYIFKDESNRDEVYFVAPCMQNILAAEAILVELFLGVTRQNNPFLWPIRLPDANGRCNSWHVSARIGANTAMSQWIRLQSEQELGSYKIIPSQGLIPSPVWPNQSFNEILKIAFTGRIIDSEDHAIVRQLRGL